MYLKVEEGAGNGRSHVAAKIVCFVKYVRIIQQQYVYIYPVLL